MKNQIYPCFWLNGNAREAAEFYTSVFDKSRVTAQNPMVVNFEMHGQKFMALNGGPDFKPNPAISFYVTCPNIGEVEEYWEKLSDGGSVLMPLDKYEWSEKYGWLQDKFGFSWQLSFGKMEDVGQKFTPSLMFTGNNAGKAQEAIHFYTSLFKNSTVVGVLKYGAGEPDVEGYIKHAQFKLGNNVFMIMDSSHPHGFQFNEALSLVVECDDQQEIDHFWEKFTNEGEESRCGWLKDKYGVSWQIVPAVLGKLMGDPEKAPRVAEAFMKMKKFNIKELEEA